MTQQSGRKNRYKIISRLCSGGMADIYLGIQLDQRVLDRFVAIKKIHRVADSDPDMKGMFADEARIISTLSHPHIVQIFDFTEKGESFHIIMEYIDGENLGYILNTLRKKNERIPLNIGLRLMTQALEALQYIHTATSRAGKPLNIVHRDLDPRNLMLDSNGYLKIIDFGVAKTVVQTELTAPNLFKGKLSHVAPEVFTQSEIDHRADIYSLGLVLFDIATGVKPYRFGKSAQLPETIKQIVSDPIINPRELNPELPVELEQIILKACCKNRDERYQTADELHVALTRFAHNPMYGCGVASNAEVKKWFHEEFQERLAQRRVFENANLQKARKALQESLRTPSTVPPPAPDGDHSGLGSVAIDTEVSGCRVTNSGSVSGVSFSSDRTATPSVNSYSSARLRLAPPAHVDVAPLYSTMPPPPPLGAFESEDASDTFGGRRSTKRIVKVAVGTTGLVSAALAAFLFFFGSDYLWDGEKSTELLSSADPTITVKDAILLETDTVAAAQESDASAKAAGESAADAAPTQTLDAVEEELEEETPPKRKSRWSRALPGAMAGDFATNQLDELDMDYENGDGDEPDDNSGASPSPDGSDGMDSASIRPAGSAGNDATVVTKTLTPTASPIPPPKAAAVKAPAYLSGSGDWSGQKVASQGCGSCHTVDATSKTESQWEYFFSHNRHRRGADLRGLFSAEELRRVQSHLISIVEKSKTNNSGIAGVR